ALGATIVTLIVLRVFKLDSQPLSLNRIILLAIIAIALPFIVLLATHAGVRQFLADSFVIIPRAIDAVWSLPARTTLDLESARYYLPPVVYGALLALAFRLRKSDRHA